MKELIILILLGIGASTAWLTFSLLIGAAVIKVVIYIINKIGMDDHIHYKPLLLWNILLLLIGCYIGVQIGKEEDDIFTSIIVTTIIQILFNSLFIVFFVAKRHFYK